MRDGLVAAALGVTGVGAAVGRPAVALLAAVPLAVLAAGVISAPAPPDVRVSRALSNSAPGLGERVTVRVTVENEGATIADCLIEDTLPESIDALEKPTRSVRLPAGVSTTLEYTVVARRGTHEFGDIDVTARGLLESASVTATPEDASETTLSCRPSNGPLQLRAPVSRQVGDRTADTGGSGVEFHSVREYRPSDPQRRIDWRRFARTRELTTVEFREDSTATVQVVVDTRLVNDVRADRIEPSALAYCVDAAERLALAFAMRETAVGVGLYPGALGAVSPGTGRPHRTRIERLFEGHESFPWGNVDAVPSSGAIPTTDCGAADADATGNIGTVAGSLPEELRRNARIVFLTPCLDDVPVEFVELVSAAGEDIGVIAPDIGGETPGAVVERALRTERLGRLEEADVPLVNWRVETPLERAIEEVFATWT